MSRPDAPDVATKPDPSTTRANQLDHAAKNSKEPALVVNHLTKRFGDRVAFSDVSFEVAHGEVFGFLGP
ncbi:MAG: hypothetical protein WAN30_08485, partial [Acidimicrobiales bacterium]